jgi:hypothetical protein
MKVILSVPDEGYSERTWWMLFWAYLMKVISRNSSYTLISISTFCKGSHPSDIGDRSQCWLCCLDPKIKEVAIVRIKTIWAFYININVILSTASCRLTGLKYLSVFWFTDSYLAFHFVNRIGGVMVSVFSSSAVDRGFEPRSGQAKDYKISICCFSAKHTALRRKNTY